MADHRLLSDYRALNRWFEGLDEELHDRITLLLFGSPDDETKVEEHEVPAELYRMCRLELPTLSTLVSVRTSVSPISQGRWRGDNRTGYVAEGRVQFTGSRLLLRTAPEAGFKFPYQGRINKTTVDLLDIVPSLDLTDFVAEANAELNRARDALHRSYPALDTYNERLRVAIDRAVKTY